MSDRFLLYNLQTDKALTVSDERISDRKIVIAKSSIEERSWWEIEQQGAAFRFTNIATSRQLFVSRQDQQNGDWLIEAATNGSFFRIGINIAGTVAIGSNDPVGDIFVAGDTRVGEHVAELRAGIEAERSAFVLLRQTKLSSERALIFNPDTAQTWFVSNDHVGPSRLNAVEAQPINDSSDVQPIEERKFFTAHPGEDGFVRIFNPGTNLWLNIAEDSVVGVADPAHAGSFFVDVGPEVGLSELRSRHSGKLLTAIISDDKLGGDETVRVTDGAYLAARAAVVFLQPWVPFA